MGRKQIVGILLAAGLFLMAGCGRIVINNESGKNEQAGESLQEEEKNVSKEETGEEEDDKENEDLGQLGDDNPFSEGTTYSFEEITISIPDFWEGKYWIEQGEEGFSLIQTASYEKAEEMGFICGFYRTDRMVLDEAGAIPLAYTDTQTYYMVEPTDVCFYYEDEQIAGEYHEMFESVGAIAASMEIDKEGVQYNPDEFMLPLSNTIPVKEEELLNFSDNELSIARNEIYARHGRQFDSIYLQNYFETCSWYEGTVPAKEFDEAVLSQIERDNLQTLKKAEEAYQREHPYPKEYALSDKVKEDLDGDGTEEEIRYSLKEVGEQGEYSGRLIIDGQEYKLEDYNITLENPLGDVFYVTDIAGWLDEEKGLEIAVLDNGPSDDPVTHFFAYKEELYYIGSVPGFPFKKKSGYNGFTTNMNVKGTICLDMPHTCYGYSYWWYDTDNRKLVEEEPGYYSLVPEGSHQLYEDLTVYQYTDEKGLKTIIPAQEKVFFMEVYMETEKEGWVLVKGKDGSKGYIHVVDGKITGTDNYRQSKELGEVFSDIHFAG